MPDCGNLGYGIDEYMDSLRSLAYEKGLPFKGVFELTPRCNFNCNMCYVHLHSDEIAAVGREFSASGWISLAKEAQQAGVMELTLTGGEPFIRSDFREIYEAAHDMGFLIQIFSNGYLIDEKTMLWLKERPPRAMRFTIYGASDETYERVCGIKDGFTKVKRAVELIKEYGIPLYLVTTVTKENERDLDDIYRFAAENHLPVTHTSELAGAVRGASADAGAHQVERKLPPDEIIRQIRKQGGGRYPRAARKSCLDVCGNYRRAFWITWNGKMQLCTFLSEPAVDVEAGAGAFMESWRKLLKELETLRDPEKCSSCRYERYCDRCPGILYAQSGDSAQAAEAYCRNAKFNYMLYGAPLGRGEK